MTLSGKPLYLIGAGGHAKVLFDTLSAQGITLAGYVDPKQSAWLDEKGVARMDETALSAKLADKPQLVMGFVGLDSASLQRRLEMMRGYQQRGATFPALIHPSAQISAGAVIGHGAQIMPGAVVNAGAHVDMAAIVNSSAVVEHDAHVGAGAHIAPRAVVLGGARIGECAFIASGAVVVQNSSVPAKSFVKALTVHK